MSPFSILCDLRLACWSTVLLGFRKHWVGRVDVFDYAMNQLLEGCGGEAVALIAGGEDYSDERIIEIITKDLNAIDVATDIDKWRLAFLISIDLSSCNSGEKLQRLQEIYADFGYPEDMADCSIYAENEIGPLGAMREVVDALREKFCETNRSG